jgi:RNA polymerase sigma-70 factor (ECF subfamily)
MFDECISVTSELIHAAQRGNLHAFNCLVSVCQDKIYDLVCRMLPLEEEKDPVLQSVIQRMYRDLHDYRNGDFRLWMLKTVIKACRSFMNEHRRAGNTGTSLEACLGGLPPNLRLVIVLVDMEGLNYAQAAAVLGIPRWTVRKRLARARQRIAEITDACREGAYA